MPIYVAALLLFVAVAACLVLWFGLTARTLVEMLLFWLGLAPMVVRHTPALYLAYSKLKFWTRNTPTTWDLSVRYHAFGSLGSLDSFAQKLISWAGQDSALMTSATNRVVLRLRRRFILEAHLDPGAMDLVPEGTTEPTLHLALGPLTVGYRDSRGILENELLPLLERVRDQTAAKRIVYALRVDLPAHNPFYGLYIEQLGLDRVTDFRVDFRIPAANRRGEITVGKTRLTVLADTLETFRTASAAALAFKVPGA